MAAPKIDARAIILEPIDFSFKDMLNLEEIVEHQPRSSHGDPKKRNGKYVSRSLKLGYNALADITGLYEWCESSFERADQIVSLDLSFNCLRNIPDEIIKFEGLKCLYLHGNKLSDLEEMEKLKKLPCLTTLAIHGNPFEKINGFRHYILINFPALRQINFGGISKADKETAAVWMKSNKKPMKLNEQKKIVNSN